MRRPAAVRNVHEDTDGPVRAAPAHGRRPALSMLGETYYRPLVRLAALLIGDPVAAELVAGEALAAPRSRAARSGQGDELLRFLQHQVIVRCRLGRRQRSASGQPDEPSANAGPAGGPLPRQSEARDFAFLPVVRALQELPPRAREAIVLIYYLDLTERQAAAVAGVREAVLRRRLDEALRTLKDEMP